MDKNKLVGIYLDLDVLADVDTYRAELQRAGKTTDRSALVNAALIEYIQRRREEAAKEPSNA